MKLFKRKIMPLLYVVALLCVGCSSKSPEPTKLEGQTMGTYWRVTIAEPIDKLKVEDIQKNIEQVLAYVNKQMSTYDPKSALSLFNAQHNLEPYKVSSAFLKNVVTAMKISESSNGYYDITVGPLVNLWGFGPRKITHKPTESEITAALNLVGYHNLVVDAENSTITKKIPDMEIDLSSIAKGYGVDAVSEKLETLGFHDFLVDIGGELIAHGSKFGNPWTVAVEKPENGQSVEKILTFIHGDSGQTAMATSGNYRNFIDFGKDRAVHTVNPHTGMTVKSNLLSVTVIQDNCMQADGYATALMALGADKAEAFADKYHLPVLFIFGNQSASNPFSVVYSEAWKRKFVPKENK